MNIPISLADQPGKRALIDGFFRAVTYLRVSVTDRCDLRCLYCMSPDMTFLPKKDLLTLGELDRICSVFIARGVRRLRLTGGEPLMRRGFLDLVRGLSRHLKSGDLQELTLTTNGTQLSRYAADLAAAGVQADQRLARYARFPGFQGNNTRRRHNESARRHRGGPESGSEGEDQYGGP